jgi:beta-galactosidase
MLRLNNVLLRCPRGVPALGKVCDQEHMTMDIKLMKAANINAVRCSHYPNDSRW